jgi:hypothetical protein
VFNPSLPKFNAEYVSFLKSAPPAEFGIPEKQLTAGYLLWLLDSSLDVVESLSRRFDFNSELRQACISLVQLKKDLPALKESKPSEWTFRLEKIPPIAVYILWLVSNESALKEFLINWRHVKSKTTGGDLKMRGLAPGPRYAEILTKLRAARLDGEIKNDKEEYHLLNTLV